MTQPPQEQGDRYTEYEHIFGVSLAGIVTTEVIIHEPYVVESPRLGGLGVGIDVAPIVISAFNTMMDTTAGNREAVLITFDYTDEERTGGVLGVDTRGRHPQHEQELSAPTTELGQAHEAAATVGGSLTSTYNEETDVTSLSLTFPFRLADS